MATFTALAKITSANFFCNTRTRPHNINTIFIRTLAAATINFSLAGVRLLIEGGSYSMAAFSNFGATPLGDIDMIDLFFRTDFQIFDIVGG